MRLLPHPGGFRRPVAVSVAALGCLALAGPAAGAVVPTLTRVTQEGGIAADCTAPLPGGAGAASALYNNAAGTGTIRTDWNIPAQITAGSQVTLGLQITATQGYSGLILLNAPADFGGQTPPFEVAGSVGPGGGSFTGAKTITFTPTHAFTPGETHVLRLGNGCNAFLYEYVSQGTPDAPAAPATPVISPRTTRPVPGVVTSYAAPRPGTVVALPFPATGCAPPATTAAFAADPPAGGECAVDIFVRRSGGKAIDDPDAVFGIDSRIKKSNLETAFRVCFAQAIDLGVALGKSNELFSEADRRFTQCVLVVSRILERADELKAQRLRPSEFVSHAARSCRGRAIRLRGQARRAAPVKVVCSRTADRTRLTLRSARAGTTVGDLVDTRSALVVGRGTRGRSRPGDRIDVLWTITPPPTTTTILTPTPLTQAALR